MSRSPKRRTSVSRESACVAWRRTWRKSGVGLFAWADVVFVVRYAPNGFPIKAWTLPVDPSGGMRELDRVDGEVCKLLKKPTATSGAGSVPAGYLDPTFAKEYPTLWQYLTQTTWEDGTPREPSSLLIFPQDGVFKCMVRDKAAGLCLWVACRQMSQLLDAVESALADPVAEWRHDRQGAGETAKRVKRSG